MLETTVPTAILARRHVHYAATYANAA